MALKALRRRQSNGGGETSHPLDIALRSATGKYTCTHTHTFIHLLRSGLGTICKHNFVGKISVHARCVVIESVNLRR
jgi:hypothetical protein